tara:strand:- start:9 stop:125 length:117 start_codon:yes stop_codon:yes gene_type:complete
MHPLTPKLTGALRKGVKSSRKYVSNDADIPAVIAGKRK